MLSPWFWWPLFGLLFGPPGPSDSFRADLAWSRTIRDSVEVELQTAAPRSRGSRLTWPGRAPLGFYQRYVSSQDAMHCQFLPSCSEFARTAIARKGAVVGFLMASDRVQRCSAFSRYLYPRDRLSGRLSDPFDAHVGISVGATEEHPSSGKSPVAAALLSTVIPGSGKVYAGRPLEGVSAALGTALPAVFARDNFRRDGVGSARGWFHVGMASAFYFGGIWGAAHAARLDSRPALAAGDRGSSLSPRERMFQRRIAHWDSIGASHEGADGREARYRAALVEYAAGHNEAAAARCLDLRAGRESAELDRRILSLQTAALIRLHRWRAVRATLQTTVRDAASPPDDPHAQQTLRLLADAEQESGPSTRRAAVFSALLPGLGQAYAHDWGRAIASLALNTVTTYYAVHCARTRSHVELIATSLPLFWRYYRGGIERAGNSARERRWELGEKKSRRMLAALGLDEEAAIRPAPVGPPEPSDAPN